MTGGASVPYNRRPVVSACAVSAAERSKSGG
jgi:hypothetical protein